MTSIEVALTYDHQRANYPNAIKLFSGSQLTLDGTLGFFIGSPALSVTAFQKAKRLINMYACDNHGSSGSSMSCKDFFDGN